MKPSAKHYAVLESPDENHTLVCFSLDAVRPDSYMAALEKELLKKSYCGDILLDLLLTNGESSRRFMKLKFDGQRLYWLQAKTASPSTIDKKILHFCQKFYATNAWALPRGVLSPAAQHRIKSSLHVDA